MNKNLDKLKQFFRSSKTNSAQEKVYVLDCEIEKELRKESTEKRIKLMKDLGDVVLSNRLEEVKADRFTLCSCDLSVHLPISSSPSKDYGRLRLTSSSPTNLPRRDSPRSFSTRKSSTASTKTCPS